MARLTDDEKRHRRHIRRAAKVTAQERAEAGLFVELVKPTTPADEWRRWRRNVARAAEDRGLGAAAQALQWLTLNDWRRQAIAVVPHLEAAELLLREWNLQDRRAGIEYYADLWAAALRRHGIEPGDWCTPSTPEEHDDQGQAARFAAIFPTR